MYVCNNILYGYVFVHVTYMYMYMFMYMYMYIIDYRYIDQIDDSRTELLHLPPLCPGHDGRNWKGQQLRQQWWPQFQH